MVNIPRPYDPDVGAEICEALATSDIGLEKLCQKNPHWPCASQIWRWLANEENIEFIQKYARARRHQVEVRVDKAYAIACDNSKDWTVDDKGKVVADHDHISRSKLQIDTIKWLASKLAPKLYGDNYDLKGTFNLNDTTQRMKDAENEYKKSY